MALLACWFWLLPIVIHEKEEVGRMDGKTSASIDIAHKIHDVLGDDFHRSEPHELFYAVKDISVLVVNRNGVKTLRLDDDKP